MSKQWRHGVVATVASTNLFILFEVGMRITNWFTGNSGETMVTGFKLAIIYRVSFIEYKEVYHIAILLQTRSYNVKELIPLGHLV